MTTNLAVAEGFLAWEALGACVIEHIDPEVFFPERVGRGRYSQKDMNLKVNRALAVCDHCPVRKPCRDKARAIHATIGVWGGEFLGVERWRRPNDMLS